MSSNIKSKMSLLLNIRAEITAQLTDNKSVSATIIFFVVLFVFSSSILKLVIDIRKIFFFEAHKPLKIIT